MEVTPEIGAVLRQAADLFRKKFGRDPDPDDPLFFDPDSETPQPYPMDRYRKEVAGAAWKAGLDPAKIYAMNKTGVIATEGNWEKLLPEDRRAWSEAINEYQRTVPGANEKPEQYAGIHYVNLHLRLQFKPELAENIIAVARQLNKENTSVLVDSDDPNEERMRPRTDEELQEEIATGRDAIEELMHSNPVLSQLGIEIIGTSSGREQYAKSFEALLSEDFKDSLNRAQCDKTA